MTLRSLKARLTKKTKKIAPYKHLKWLPLLTQKKVATAFGLFLLLQIRNIPPLLLGQLLYIYPHSKYHENTEQHKIVSVHMGHIGINYIQY